jgi:hypothetical protein
MIHLHKAPPGAELITKGTEAFNMVVQQYPLKYTVAESRMKKYYFKELAASGMPDIPVEAMDIPQYAKKKLKEGIFSWVFMTRTVGGQRVRKEALFNTVTNEFVLKNPRTAGTPRILPINGQDFWSSGEGQQWNRSKLKEFLYDYYASRIVQQLPEGIWAPKGSFIHLEYIFYFPFKIYEANDVQDLDNHSYPYVKVFKDVLQTLGVIKGDDFRYVRGDYSRYMEVETEEERRLEIKIHFCENEGLIIPRIYKTNHVQIERDPL